MNTYKKMKNPIKTLAALTLGYAGGLLLAQKTGKTLRKELKKSENPAKIMFNAMKDADMGAFDDFKDWWKNSENIQTLLKTGKKHFDNIVKDAGKYGQEAVEKTTKELERVSKEAKNAAKKLKGTTKKVEKKATKFKNELKKEVKIIAKKIKK